MPNACYNTEYSYDKTSPEYYRAAITNARERVAFPDQLMYFDLAMENWMRQRREQSKSYFSILDLEIDVFVHRIVDYLNCPTFCWVFADGTYMNTKYGYHESIMNAVYMLRDHQAEQQYCRLSGTCSSYHDAYRFMRVRITAKQKITMRKKVRAAAAIKAYSFHDATPFDPQTNLEPEIYPEVKDINVDLIGS